LFACIDVLLVEIISIVEIILGMLVSVVQKYLDLMRE
jgi:hypothetical protein